MTQQQKFFAMVAAVTIVVAAAAIWLGVRQAKEEAPTSTPEVALQQARERLERVKNRPAGTNGVLSRHHRTIPPAREKSTLDQQQSQQLLARLNELLDSQDEDNIAEAVSDSAKLNEKHLIEFSARALPMIGDAGVRRDVLQGVAGLKNKAILPIVAQGMKDRDPEVRTAAVNALAYLNYDAGKGVDNGNGGGGTSDADEGNDEKNDSEWAGDSEESQKNAEEAAKWAERREEVLSTGDEQAICQMLLDGLKDDDSSVRMEVMSLLGNISPELQMTVLAAAVNSGKDDIQREAMHLISGNYNQDTITLAFDALSCGNDQVKSQAQMLIKHMLDKEFSSAQEAHRWWKENAEKYDYNLSEIQTTPQDGSMM